jgi:hypothetical protein
LAKECGEGRAEKVKVGFSGVQLLNQIRTELQKACFEGVDRCEQAQESIEMKPTEQGRG